MSKHDSPILVTGAGGFIGSHLVETALQAGHSVRALVRYTSTGHAGWLDQLSPELRSGLEIVLGDVRDRRAVRQAAEGTSAIYHLAALIGIPYSYVAPDSYVEVNVQGTLNVLEAARDLDIQRTVVTSTSEVYGTALYTPIDEKHPLQAQSPYSATKIGADALAISYHRAFGLPVSIVRPFNTFGPRQSTRAVIPTIITQALGGNEIRLGSLTPVRDMVYVGDTAAGFLAVGQSDACIGRVTNLATGVGVSVGDLVDRILSLVGRTLPVVAADERIRPDKSEVFELIGSAADAKRMTGWQPRVSLEEGLQQTVDWLREHLHHYQVGAYGV